MPVRRHGRSAGAPGEWQGYLLTRVYRSSRGRDGARSHYDRPTRSPRSQTGESISGDSAKTAANATGKAGGAIVRPARAADLHGLLTLYAELADDPARATPIDDRRRPGARRRARGPRPSPRRRGPRRADRGHRRPADRKNLTHGARTLGNRRERGREPRRREGVGRLLFEQLLERARAADCYKLQLLSAKHRVEAHRFYRAIGFESVAEGFKLYLDDGH